MMNFKSICGMHKSNYLNEPVLTVSLASCQPSENEFRAAGGVWKKKVRRWIPRDVNVPDLAAYHENVIRMTSSTGLNQKSGTCSWTRVTTSTSKPFKWKRLIFISSANTVNRLLFDSISRLTSRFLSSCALHSFQLSQKADELWKRSTSDWP